MENLIEKNQVEQLVTEGFQEELYQDTNHEEVAFDDDCIEEIIFNQNDEMMSDILSISESQTENMESNHRDFNLYRVSQKTTRSSSENRTYGALSLVYAKTGNRLTLSKEITLKLGHPTEVQLIYNDTEIIIGTNLISESPRHKVSYQQGRGMIYSKALVKELIDYYQIDFTHRTSCSLGSLSFGQDSHQNDNQPYAIITNIKL